MPTKFTVLALIQCALGIICLADGNIFTGMTGTALLVAAAITSCTGTIVKELRRIYPIQTEEPGTSVDPSTDPRRGHYLRELEGKQ